MTRRILVLSDLWLPFPGGAERLMFNVARDLDRRGHEVAVVTGYEAAQEFDGPWIRYSGELGLDDAGWAQIEWEIDAYRPDVILTHHIYADLFWRQLAALGVPVVRLHYHGTRPGADLVVHISEHVALAAGSHPEDLTLRPPAFDDIVADQHGDAIGFVKPLPHKGAELIYAIAEAMPERQFVILRGEWQDLELIRPDLANVRYLGPVDDMRDFYRRVRIVLMPSLSEDAGTVAQEATMNGLPCISSAAGGLAETNAGGIQLTPGAENVGHWVAAIRWLDQEAATYGDIVRSQRDALPDWQAGLDELNRRIEAL